MMSFKDFLDHAEAKFRKEDILSRVFPSSKSKVFYLGEDEKVADSIDQVISDVLDEMHHKIPMPFSDISCVSTVVQQKDGPLEWVMDRVIEMPGNSEILKAISQGLAVTSYKEGMGEDVKNIIAHKAPQIFLIVRIDQEMEMALSWVTSYYGTVRKQLLFTVVPTKMLLKVSMGQWNESGRQALAVQTSAILKQIAAISHPANYVVKVSPKLTPHEERRAQAGKETAAGKRPHFIVVDHEVLVQMRKGDGTHASPIPHDRRGHWRRLADHCRHAKLMGKEKIFVRPTFVGSPSFSDTKNMYDVLLDFGKKSEEVSPLSRN